MIKKRNFVEEIDEMHLNMLVFGTQHLTFMPWCSMFNELQMHSVRSEDAEVTPCNNEYKQCTHRLYCEVYQCIPSHLRDGDSSPEILQHRLFMKMAVMYQSRRRSDDQRGVLSNELLMNLKHNSILLTSSLAVERS